MNSIEIIKLFITIGAIVLPILITHLISHGRSVALIKKAEERIEMTDSRITRHEDECLADKKLLRKELREDFGLVHQKMDKLAEKVSN